MVGSVNLVLFSIAAWALILTPGPDMLYVITRGISQGRKAGMLSAAGVVTGILVQTILASLGLAAVLQSSELAFQVVKYLGAGYLLYLGIRAILSKEQFSLDQSEEDLNPIQIYSQGVLSNVFNPKVTLFFLAFLPQFISEDTTNFALNIALLGLLFAFYGLIFLSLVGFSAGKIGSWINTNPSVSRKIPLVTGGILVGLGFRLAFMKRL